ncbi:MAG: DUF2752 domain-containing protein [Planctomycetota bacterium]|nr:MAG: DUF2752 domain-containing protein [Planctomycetota bacterium]
MSPSLPSPPDSGPSPPDGRRSFEHFSILVFAALGVIGLLVLGTFATPDERGYGTHEQLGLPSCKSIEWLGIPCPGCGVTTSIALVAHGRLGDGLRNQPLGFALAFAIPLFALWALRAHRRGRDLYIELCLPRRRALAGWTGLVVVVAWAWKIRAHLGG